MMERDFMGLNSKEGTGKEEVANGCKNSGFTKSSGVPWQVCNKTIIGASSKQQIYGGVPVLIPHQSLPSTGISAGTTDSLYNPKGGGPAQLTIFYGGKVNVFDEITPEKAQAIMILARNHCSAQNIAQKRLQVQSPTDKLTAKDSGLVNLTVNNTSPKSALSSPISVSSHPVGQIGGSPTRNDEPKSSKTIGTLTNLVNKVEPSNSMGPLGHVATPTIIPSAVPQFRKASLTRFLERRKQRVINSAPYNLMKETSDNSKPESLVAGGSAASLGGSVAPSAC